MNGQNDFSYSPAIPDFRWINREIPILEIAAKLGIIVRGNKAQCLDCGKERRLSFTPKLNGWKCFHCEPAGKMHTPLDLVMKHRDCSVYAAADWISRTWGIVGRVQIERSKNAYASRGPTYVRYRPIPAPHKSRPSLEAFMASPAWREMPLTTRTIAMALFAMANAEDSHTVTISRKELAGITGIQRLNTISHATRELKAIRMFAVEQGFGGKLGSRASSYRLTWWSQSFQVWLSQGYALPGEYPLVRPDTPTPHPAGTRNSVALVTPSIEPAEKEQSDEQLLTRP
jgi:hypothetical protein